MGRKDLVKAVARRTGVPERVVETVLDAFVDEVVKNVSKGERVLIPKVGALQLVKRLGAKRINPVTQQMMDIPDRMYPRFRPSQELKTRASL